MLKTVRYENISEFERKTVILTIHNWMKHDCTWPVYFIVRWGTKIYVQKESAGCLTENTRLGDRLMRSFRGQVLGHSGHNIGT